MGEAAVNSVLQLEDIQGLVARGYPSLRAAAFLVLEVADPAAARRWLGSIAPAVTTAAQRRPHRAVNVAVTASGLSRLGLAPQVLAGFSPEFRQGMAEPSRARVLGDVDTSSPATWAWGGPGGRPVHLLLLLYATDPEELSALLAEHGSPPGLRVVAHLDTVDLGDREHFGFHDGISQPVVEGLSKKAPAASTIRAGEFLLGYPNEYGQTTGAPAFGRNGSYLVLRQLEQDVDGFWHFCREATCDDAGGSASVALAARMVGRWPGGAPLVLSPDRDDPALAGANDFGYLSHDPYGERCPIGAHVRRTNPRDSLDPIHGSERSAASARRHRILRRGRSYGTEGARRGLHFICLNANLSRQFEFVQRSWVNNPHFGGLYDDADPLVAPHQPAGGTFTVQGSPARRRYAGLPRFVTVQGGAYFLMPGVRALSKLSAIAG
jgi:Dyp-type peroxidase family